MRAPIPTADWRRGGDIPVGCVRSRRVRRVGEIAHHRDIILFADKTASVRETTSRTCGDAAQEEEERIAAQGRRAAAPSRCRGREGRV